MRRVRKFGYANETTYSTREVAKIVRWVMKYLEVEQYACYIKIKHHSGRHAYQGRFFAHARTHRASVWDETWGEYKTIGPVIPAGMDHLIVCRIAKPGAYPCATHVYDRKDSPGSWIVEDWQEALVSVLAHEAMHLRQYAKNPVGVRGRFNEVETEWAAYRLCMEWRNTRQNASVAP